MPFTVCGSWAAFLYALQGVFSLCGAFSFCVGVRIYAAELCGRCAAFSGHCGRRFRFGVVFCVRLLLVVSSVTAQILLVLAFCSVGSVFIYP